MLARREAEEVKRWLVAFHLKRGEWRHERLIPGSFAHVSALARLDRNRSWLVYSFSPLTGPCVAVFPFEAEDETKLPPGLADWVRNASILSVKVRQKRDFTPKWGFFCVSSVKMLTGSASRALFPQALWRDLRLEGAEVVFDGVSEGPVSPARSGSDRADGAGAERPAEGGAVLS